MDPTTIALLLQSLGMLQATSEGQGNAEYTRQASEYNAQQQMQDSAAARAQAERTFKYSTAPTTNLRGDVTRYDPVRGWIVEPSDTTQRIQGSSDAAQSALLGDALNQIRGLGLDQTRRLQEFDQGDAAIANLAGRQSSDTITPLLQQLASRSVNRGFDDTQEVLSRLGLRTGQDSTNAVSNMAKDRAETLSNELLRSTAQGQATNDQLQGSELSRLLGTYQALRAPSSFQGFNPTSDTLTPALLSQRNIVPQASQSNAYGIPTARVTITPADHSLSNSLIVGGSLFGNYSREQQRSVEFDKVLQYLASSRQPNTTSQQPKTTGTVR